MKQERLRDDDDMGFADVDTDWICQLVGYLEKHVVAASNIDVIQETYSAIQKIRSKKASFTFDQVRQEHKKEKFMGDFLKGCNKKYWLFILLNFSGSNLMEETWSRQSK